VNVFAASVRNNRRRAESGRAHRCAGAPVRGRDRGTVRDRRIMEDVGPGIPGWELATFDDRAWIVRESSDRPVSSPGVRCTERRTGVYPPAGSAESSTQGKKWCAGRHTSAAWAFPNSTSTEKRRGTTFSPPHSASTRSGVLRNARRHRLFSGRDETPSVWCWGTEGSLRRG